MFSKVKSPNKYLLYSAVIIAVILLIMLIGKITTQVIKKVFINIVSSKLDKKVEIDGNFIINYSFSPSVHISDLKIINNIVSGQSEFLIIGTAFIKLELFPLIRNRIYIDEINISDVVINLEKNADGNKNWELPHSKEQDEPFNLPGDIAVNELLLTNILINYYNLESGNKEDLYINNVQISLPKNSNLNANLLGSYLDNSVELKLTGGSYKELKDKELYWPFDIYGNLVSSDLNASGKLKNLLNLDDLDLSLKLNSKKFDLEPVFNILANVYNESLNNYTGDIEDLNLEVTNLNKGLLNFLILSSVDLSISNLNILKLNSKNNEYEKFLNFNSGEIILNNNENTRLNISGSLIGYPLLINANGCNKSLYLNKGENCKISVKAAHGNSDFNINGFINLLERDFLLNIKTKLNIPDIHQYKFLFDVPKGLVIPVKASFIFEKNRRDISISDINILLGKSDLSGKYEEKFINNRLNINISLFSNKLNINEIIAVLPKHDDDKDSDYSLKVKILPNNLSVYDGTTKIDLNNVIYHNLLIDKFFVNSRIKDNIETGSEFIILSADGDFKGIYDLNLAPDLPVAKFKIKSRNVDLGKISHDLGFAENVHFKAKQLDLELNIVGSTLEEILRNSSLTANSKDGEYIVKDLNTDSNFEIIVKKAHLQLFAHKPILITFDGIINEQTVKITLEAKHIIRSISALERGKVPIKIVTAFADTNIIIEGFAVFPLNRKTSEIRVTVKGKKLSDFNPLLDVDFPDEGPYRLSTDLNVTDQGYNLKNIDFVYASTELTGFLNIVTSGPKPYFDIKINAEVLNIDDLFSSRIKAKTSENTDKKQGPSGEDAKIPQINSFDADFDFTISKIILSDEEIGDFEYTGKIINGELLSNRAILNILGGEAEFEINVLDVDNELKISLEGFLENFDYSPLARMIDPESLTEGIMDVVVNIESRGTTFAELDDNLDGKIKLRIIPTLIDAGLVNIWALGLIDNLMPNLTQKEKEAPKVNCIIGKFKAKNGILRPDDLKIDTTNVRISVVGKINLTNENINLVFRPVAKKTQLINLGIPMRVVGTFENYNVITDPYNIGWYILTLAIGVYDIISQTITGNYKPEDGSDICNRDIVNN